MCFRRSLHIALIATTLFATLPLVTFAAPATPVPSASTHGRRFVSLATRSPYFPGVESTLEFGNSIHEPGLGCVYAPPELELQYLTLDRSDSGFTATVIFFGPIKPLSELNGKPVTHTVRLNFKPPKGESVAYRLSLTSGKMTVKRGKTDITGATEGLSVGLDSDRLLFAVPDSLGIESDWTVTAAVVIEGKDPICDQFPVYFRQYGTAPVTVGSLTGDDPAGVITFSPTGVVNGAKSGAPFEAAKMPKGTKITTLRLEQDSQGNLVAVATMDADVTELATSAPAGMFTVALNLAGPDFFGVIHPYRIEWTWTTDQPEMPPLARVFAPIDDGFPMGTVPVTVDGREIRFEFGGYAPAKQSTLEPDPVTQLPFGDFTSSFIGEVTLAGATCVCAADEVPADIDLDPAVTYENFRYDIIGNLLSITRLSTGSIAYGWIDRDGRFLVENKQERYRGLIRFIPNGESFDIGVKAIYAQKLDDGDGQAQLPLNAVSLVFSQSKADSPRGLRAAPYVDVATLYIMLDELIRALEESSEVDCSQPNPPIACADIEFGSILVRLIQEKTEYEKEILDYIQKMQTQTNGMGLPPTSFSGNLFAPQLSTAGAQASLPDVPFPLPLDTAPSEFEPLQTNPDWAIRAGSFFYATVDNPLGEFPTIAGPWVDSHLLITDSTSSANNVNPEIVGIALLHERRWVNRRSVRYGKRMSGPVDRRAMRPLQLPI